MAELKTKETKASVSEFLNKISEEQKKADCKIICKMMEKASGAKAKMWGPAIIGFGSVQLKYESGRELDWFIMGFSPRKQNIVLYGLAQEGNQNLFKKLDKHKTGKACIYLNKLEELDLNILQEILNKTVAKAFNNK